MGKSLSNKYSQKLLDSAEKFTADAIKTASKRAIPKTAEAAGDLIGNTIADKKSANYETEEEDAKRTTHKIYISRRKTRDYWWIKVSTKRECIFLEIIDKLMLTLKKDTYLQKKDNKLLMN